MEVWHNGTFIMRFGSLKDIKTFMTLNNMVQAFIVDTATNTAFNLCKRGNRFLRG